MKLMRPQNVSMHFNAFIFFLLVGLTGALAYSPFDESKWIWGQDLTPDRKAPPGSHSFRRVFQSKTESPAPCIILITSDDIYHLFLNGEHLGSGDQTHQAQFYHGLLQPGKNVFAINATNLLQEPNPAGVLVDVQVPHEDGNPERIVSDASWRVNHQVQNGFQQLEYDDSSWPHATVVGDYGSEPWGHIRVPPVPTAYGTHEIDFGSKLKSPSSYYLSQIQSEKHVRYPKTKLLSSQSSAQPAKPTQYQYGDSYTHEKSSDRHSASERTNFRTPINGDGLHGNLGVKLTLSAPSASPTAISHVPKPIGTGTSLLGGILDLVGSILSPSNGQNVNKQSSNPTHFPSSETQPLSLSANVGLSINPKPTSRKNIVDTLGLATQVHPKVEPTSITYPQRGQGHDLGGVASEGVRGNLTPAVQHVDGATKQIKQTGPLQETEDNEPGTKLSETTDRILDDKSSLEREAKHPSASRVQHASSPSRHIPATHVEQESQPTPAPGIGLLSHGKKSIGLKSGVTVPGLSQTSSRHKPGPRESVAALLSAIGQVEAGVPGPTVIGQHQKESSKNSELESEPSETSGQLGKRPHGTKSPLFAEDNDQSESINSSASDEFDLQRSTSRPGNLLTADEELGPTRASGVQGAPNRIGNIENDSGGLGINPPILGSSTIPKGSQPLRPVASPSFSSGPLKEGLTSAEHSGSASKNALESTKTAQHGERTQASAGLEAKLGLEGGLRFGSKQTWTSAGTSGQETKAQHQNNSPSFHGSKNPASESGDESAVNRRPSAAPQKPTPTTSSGQQPQAGHSYGAFGAGSAAEPGSEGATQEGSQYQTSNSNNNQQAVNGPKTLQNAPTRTQGIISEDSSVGSKNTNRKVIVGEGPGSAGPAIVSILGSSGTGGATAVAVPIGSGTNKATALAANKSSTPSATSPTSTPASAASEEANSKSTERNAHPSKVTEGNESSINLKSSAATTGGIHVESAGNRQSTVEEISKSKAAGEKSVPKTGTSDKSAVSVAKSSTKAAPLDVPCGCPPKSTDPLSLKNANWIWTNEIKNGVAPVGARAFRRVLILPRGLKATGVNIQIGVDDHFSLYVQGKLVGSGQVWSAAHTFDVDLETPTSEVVIAVNAANAEGGPAGLVADIQLVIEGCDGSPVPVASDSSWKYSTSVPAGFEKPEYDDAAWDFAKIEGKYGMSPWGQLSMPYGVVKAKSG